MLDVHDAIANFQISEVGEKRANWLGHRRTGPSLLVEDVWLAEDEQSGVWQTETAGQPARGHEQRRAMGPLGLVHRQSGQVVISE